MKQHFILFGTECCHLCEQAKALLSTNEAVREARVSIEIIDIAEHSQWFDKYSVLIPVFYHEQTEKELRWPFDQQALTTFIDGVVANN